MGMHLDRTGKIRSVKSKLGSVLGLGSVAALVLGGVAFIGVLPAAATGPTTIAFSTPPSPTTAVIGQPISFAVEVTGGTATDTINITSTCGQGGTDSGVANGPTSAALNFTNFQFTSTGATCAITATDATTAGTPETATQTVDVTAFGTPTKLGFSVAPPTSGTADAVLTTFKVSTEDAYGNIVTSAPVDNIVISSSCTVGGVDTVAEVTGTGTATFSDVTINSAGTCLLTATDITSPDTGFTGTFSVSVTGGTPAKLAYVVAPPTSVLTTGSLVTAFEVAVEDSSGNRDITSTGSSDVITVSSPCLAASVSVLATAGIATFTTAEFSTTGNCVLTATDASRVIVAATATSIVGTVQPALSVTTKSGYLDVPLTLATAGGAGIGTVTYTVTDGSAKVCAVSTAGVLTAKTGGTCIVTAYKAAATTYAPATSAATTVTISSAPKVLRLTGLVWNARKTTVTIIGYNFSGRPKVLSNVAGFSALVSRDSGKTLTVVVTVKGSATKPGVKVMTVVLANGKQTSFRYSLH